MSEKIWGVVFYPKLEIFSVEFDPKKVYQDIIMSQMIYVGNILNAKNKKQALELAKHKLKRYNIQSVPGLTEEQYRKIKKGQVYEFKGIIEDGMKYPDVVKYLKGSQYKLLKEIAPGCWSYEYLNVDNYPHAKAGFSIPYFPIQILLSNQYKLLPTLKFIPRRKKCK